MLTGKTASKGRALGKVFKFEKKELHIKKETCEDPKQCLKAFKDALAKSSEELRALRDRTLEKLDEDHADIFEAHIEMVNDVEIRNQVIAMIEDKKSAQLAYKTVTDQFIEIFEGMEDEYFQARAADVKDIQHRVLSHLLGEPIKDMSMVDTDTIVFATDLTPSDTANFDFSHIKGFVTETGGMTSHTAIMARAYNIPAIVGVKNALNQVEDDMLVYLDATDNKIHLDPDDATIEKAQTAIKADERHLEILKEYQHIKTKTKDGVHIPLFANIGSDRETDVLDENGAEGIGLFRTEFLFMDSDKMPSETEQIESYKKVFSAIQPVIVRTLDIGGDKALPYLDQDKEDNPFLGKRAIRLCFEEIEMFKTQIRALLKAATDQNDLRIMFPMVATRDELIRAKNIVSEVMDALAEQNETYQKTVHFGIMIEIPAAALNAEQLGREVDFFSIGTNDLIQYLFAADRMNSAVSYLYEPFDPTLLRLIDTTIKAAKATDTEIGVCGEMASNLDAALILVGLDIDELSMNPSSILEIRRALSKIPMDALKTFAEDVLEQPDAHAVKACIKRFKESFDM